MKQIVTRVLSWLFPLRGIEYETPICRLLHLTIKKGSHKRFKGSKVQWLWRGRRVVERI